MTTLLDYLEDQDTNALTKELYRMARKLVMGSTVNQNEWEDAVQSLVMRGFRAVKEWRVGVDNFVYKNMKQELRKFIAKSAQVTYSETPVGTGAEDFAIHGASENGSTVDTTFEDRIIEQTEAHEKVVAIFNDPRLTDRQREVLYVLMDCNGDRDEAAKQLGMTTNALRVALHRVRQTLGDQG